MKYILFNGKIDCQKRLNELNEAVKSQYTDKYSDVIETGNSMFAIPILNGYEYLFTQNEIDNSVTDIETGKGDYSIPEVGYCGEFTHENYTIKVYHKLTRQDNEKKEIFLGCLFLFFDANGNRLQELDTRSYVIVDMTPERAVIIPDTDITVPSFDLAYASMQQPQPLLQMVWEAVQLAIYDGSLISRITKI